MKRDPADDRVVGVDVGGTKVAFAVMTGGVLSEPWTEPTDDSSEPALIDQLVRGIRRTAGDEPVAGVGVGVPSVVDWETGTVRSSVNVPLRDVPLRSILRERLDGPAVFVDNDASLAALAEAHAPDGSLEARHLIMLTVGTGVGGGVVVDGRLYRGATGAAGEFGHIVIGADLRDGLPAHADRPPQPGSLEALASGTALDALARERGMRDGRDAVRRATEGDPVAIETVALVGRRLGVGIASLINVFDPEVVAVGGGVSAAGELLLGPAIEAARPFVLDGAGTRTEVRIARSGAEAGVRGAALLARLELGLADPAIETQRIGVMREAM